MTDDNISLVLSHKNVISIAISDTSDNVSDIFNKDLASDSLLSADKVVIDSITLTHAPGIDASPVQVASTHFLLNQKVAHAIIAGGGKVAVHVSASDIEEHIAELEADLGNISSITFTDTPGTAIHLASSVVLSGIDVLKLIGSADGSIYKLEITNTLTAISARNFGLDAGKDILGNITKIAIEDSASDVSDLLNQLADKLGSHLQSGALAITLTDPGANIWLNPGANDDWLVNDVNLLNAIQNDYKLTVDIYNANAIDFNGDGYAHLDTTHLAGIHLNVTGLPISYDINLLRNWLSTHSELDSLLVNGGGVSIGSVWSANHINSLAELEALEGLVTDLGNAHIPWDMSAVVVGPGVPLTDSQLAELNTWTGGSVKVTLSSIDGYISGATVHETYQETYR